MFINLLVKSKLKAILIISSTILVILVLISIFNIRNTYKKINGNKIKFDIESLNIENYYTSFDMTVISNKNIHTYKVEEKYIKLENSTTLKYFDFMNNVVTIELKDNICKITNSGNNLGLTSQITNNNKNISSFSAFLYIYNLICGNCNCNKNIYEKDGEIRIVLNICNEHNCVFNNLSAVSDVSKLELTLKDNKLITYVIYDKNKKEYISILYNEFKFNEFDE